MKYLFLFLVLILMICLADNSSAQFSMKIKRWTPVKAKSDVLFSYLKFDGKKSKSTFNIRSSLIKDLTLVYRKEVTAEGDTINIPSYYDVNGDSLVLTNVMRKIGLARLPSDPSKIVVRKLGDDTVSNWIFIEGANAFVWLSPLIKKSKSFYITCEARIYFMPRPLKLDSLSVQSLDDGLIVMNASRIDILSNEGKRLDLSKLGKEVMVMNRRMMPLVTEQGTSWLDLSSESPVQFGRLIKNVFAKNGRDSLSKIFFDGNTIRALWPSGNFSAYKLAPNQRHQIDLIDTSFGRASAKAVLDFGKVVAIIFADTNNQLIVRAPDSVYSFSHSKNLLYNAASDFDGDLGLIDSLGNFRVLPLNSWGKINELKVSNLQQLAARNTNPNIHSELKDSTDVAIFVSEAKNGAIDSGLILPKYRVLLEYLGIPTSAENGEFIFVKGTDVSKLMTDSLLYRVYHLGKKEFLDQEITSYRLKKFGKLRVAEISFDDNQTGASGLISWFWPESGRMTKELGSFVGMAQYDSSIYTFISREALWFLSTREWWQSHSDLQRLSLPTEYPVNSSNYSVIVYSDKSLQIVDTVDGEEFVYNEPDVMARVVCLKKQQDQFLFDQRLHIGLLTKSTVFKKEE